MSDEPVEFKGEGEDVVVVRGVPHHEGSVRFRSKDTFSSFSRQGTPVPTMLIIIIYYLVVFIREKVLYNHLVGE